MYKILTTEGRAKRAEMTTVHGVIQTPVFMNVGTVAAIKGAVSTTGPYRKLEHRWNYPTHIICMYDRVMKLLKSLVVCISL